MGQERTFLESVRTRLVAIQNVSVPLFARVYITDMWDAETLNHVLKIPRYPCAVVVNKTFSINPSNGKVKDGLFDVVIIHAKPRDVLGEATSLEISDFGDLMIDALEYESNNESIQNLASGGAASIVRKAGILYKARSFEFSYRLRRHA